MTHNTEYNLRDILEQMSIQELDEMLNKELHTVPVNGEVIRLILDVLSHREKDHPIEHNLYIDEAWEKYHQHSTNELRNNQWTCRFIKIAAVAIIVFSIIIALPQDVNALSIFEKFAQWTESIFAFFDFGTKNSINSEYIFKTDNTGLKQVYDAVIELGVTDPVVPMWLPDYYELEECNIMSSLEHTCVHSRFTGGDKEVYFSVDINMGKIQYQYPKDETLVSEFELNGTIHYIMRNNNNWVVAWTKNNVECLLTIDCQEDTLYEILKSIYVMEGK